jgi:DNA polymerase III epsilon subunit-like protein
MRTFVFDLETTNLRSDIGTVLVASFGELKPDGSLGKMHTNDKLSAGSELALAEWIYDKLLEADILIGHNSKAFDRNFLNGYFFRLGMGLAPKVCKHFDTCQTARGKLLFQSNSLENLADVLGVATKKFHPGKDSWREAGQLDKKAIKTLRTRCQEDVKATAEVWAKLGPLYKERWGE